MAGQRACPDRYDEIVLNALLVREQAASLRIAARRIRGLATALREAHQGREQLSRCAWCGRVKIGAEWLDVAEHGLSDHQQLRSILGSTTHGICPDCGDAHARASKRAVHGPADQQLTDV